MGPPDPRTFGQECRESASGHCLFPGLGSMTKPRLQLSHAHPSGQQLQSAISRWRSDAIFALAPLQESAWTRGTAGQDSNVRAGKLVGTSQAAEPVDVPEDIDTLWVPVTFGDRKDLPLRTYNACYTLSTREDGDAAASLDYKHIDESVCFPPVGRGVYESRKWVPIPIIDDTEDEFNETFSIELHSPSPPNIRITICCVTYRIIDNDGPVLLAQDVAVPEDAGDTEVVLTASYPSVQDISFTFSTDPDLGEATADLDYVAVDKSAVTMPAGATKVRLPLTILDDELVEGDESFYLEFRDFHNAAIGSSESARVTILDDDTRKSIVGLRAAAPVTEGELAAFVVHLDIASAEPIRIAYGFGSGDDTAQANEDYDAAPGELLVPSGATQASFTVQTYDDDEFEDAETFTVRLSGVPAGPAVIGGNSQARGSILDNDRRLSEVSLSAAAPVTEGELAAFVVHLDEANAEPIRLAYSFGSGDDTAQANEDYDAAPGELVIPSGATQASFTVQTHDDDEFEDAETFTAWLSGVPAGPAFIGGASQARGTILDNDRRLSEAGLRAAEPATEGELAAFVVHLDEANAEPIRVAYSFGSGDDTAEAYEDYDAAPGELVIPSGAAQASFTVQTYDDDEVEDLEMFTVRLSGVPAGPAVIGGDSEARGSILDNDQFPAFYVHGGHVSEADSQAVVRIQVAPDSEEQVTVRLATANGSATAGEDYLERAVAVVFAAGDTEREVFIPILEDDLAEGSEDFHVRLSDPVGADISIGSATVTIRDNDAPVLTIEDIAVRESDATATFTARLDAVSLVPVTAVFATSDGTATAGQDYVARTGQVRIPPGVLSREISIALIDDALTEGEEYFSIVLGAPVNAVIGLSTAEATIRDDDTYYLTVEDVTVTEDASQARFAVSLDRINPAQTTSVTVTTQDVSARAGEDYVAFTGMLEIPAGTLTRSVGVAILEDELYEGTESFAVTLGAAQNAELARRMATATILDNDPAPVVSIGDAEASEDAGHAAFAVRLSIAASRPVSLRYATADETATAGEDYAHVSGMLTFEAGAVEKQILVPVLEDDLDEEVETFTVRLSGARNAAIADGEGRGRIVDNDEPVTISIFDGRAQEGAGELHLPVRLSRQSTQVVSVQFASSDRTAEAGPDYTSSRGIAVFESGSTEGVVAVAIADDALDEEEEAFHVTLSRSVNAVIARGTASGTITDDDGEPLLRVDDITALEEAEEAAFAVRLSAPSTRTITATYQTRDGTAQAGQDYEAASGTLVFAPGEVQEEVRVRVMRDSRDWRAETFSLVLYAVSNARLEDAVATATIVEEVSFGEGVMRAHLARFIRTSASHVVEAVAERQRWQEAASACASVRGLDMLRKGNPGWDPSAGELLSGCGVAANSGAFSMWGRGAFTRFGGREGALSLGADVATATLGADYRWDGGLMAGLLLARSQASGTYEAAARAVSARSMLTGVYPFASYSVPAGRIWALAGAGRGSLEIDGAESLEANLGSRLVAAGATGTVASSTWARLSYEADAFVARAAAEEQADAGVSRLRAGLEGSLAPASWVRPYLETALRRDGGDAERGLGLEVGGGVRVARMGSRLRAEVGSRRLVMHAAEGFREWGVAASLVYAGPGGLGPTAAIRPSWGPARSGGMQALWRRSAVSEAVHGRPAEARVDLQFGYGMPLALGKGVARPLLAVAMRGPGRDYRLGYEARAASGLGLSVSGVARESVSPYRPVMYGISLHGSLAW